LEGLEVTKVQLNSDVAALTEEIDRLKAEQTVSNATAITIEAQIASEEAQIRLEIAQAKLDGYNVQDTDFKNQINDLKIFAAMGDENA
jgi:predicted  nucleic acid-binding Zn-ribbon protein